MYDLLSWDRDGEVNSGFGYRSKASTNGVGSTDHKGIDLSSDNDNIPAVMGGMVIANGSNKYRGNYITIQSYDGYTQTYQHLASQSPLAVGTKVTEGQTIGTQGSTGASTAKHLHFEVKSGSGLYVDPLDYLSGKLTGDSSSLSTLTGSHGQTVTTGATMTTSSLMDKVLDILAKVIKFIAVLVVVVLAMVLFMKSFDIKIRRPF